MSSKGLRTTGASPKGDLPKSPTKRRKFLRESDDDKGPMAIEQYIYRRDRYRSSSTLFPFPLPMSLESLSTDLEPIFNVTPSVQQLIDKSLDDHGIIAYNISVLVQFKESYPRSKNPGSCLLLQGQ